jgi:cyanophycin synthetase
MFAAAMAYAMGVKLDDIRHGLRTFDTTYFQAPGRMNIFDQHGFRVILDYGHNPAAVEAMCTLVDGLVEGGVLGAGGRRVCVLAAPGDRRDEDIAAIATRAAGSFDHFICRRDDHTRGRGPNEVPQMLKAALLAAGVSEDAIETIPEESEAVEASLSMCKPGDLLLIFADKITRSWKQVIYFGDGAQKTTTTASPAPLTAADEARELAEELGGMKLVRDSRGVMLAAPDEEAD